jgi:uncharacterized protein YbjT (DUF2867 family)
MPDRPLTILAVGATGSIGRHVVAVALEQGHAVRALVRDPARARLPAGVEIAAGALTRPETLVAAVAGIDALVFTQGASGGKAVTEAVDYGGVRNLLFALGGAEARIALMTAIGVTNRTGNYNRATEAHDWKRRGERLVRASGLPYTIVRPGWFDCNAADEHRLVLLQGDTRQSGTPRDGAVSRREIAEVLVHALTAPHAVGKTFELVAERGPAPTDFDALFAPLAADGPGTLDGVRDADNMPLACEPDRVCADLEALRPIRHDKETA